MTTDPERTPSSRPLSPAEINLSTASLIDSEQSNVDELEAFLTFQAVLFKKAGILSREEVTQAAINSFEILLQATSQHFARAVDTESTVEKKATYAAELIVQALRGLDDLCRELGKMVTGVPSENLFPDLASQLRKELEGNSPSEIFDILENIYGVICTSIFNHLLD